MRYFSGPQAAVAEKLRGILTRHLPVDLSRLHPDDGLVEDLRMDALDSLSTVEFILAIEQELGIRIPNQVASRMRTFREVVEFVARHKQV